MRGYATERHRGRYNHSQLNTRNNIGSWRDGWYVVPYDVLFRDIDFFGHVNNAVYLTYFEWARALLWFDLTGQDDPSGIGFIVARAEVDFRQQIEMEPIDICCRIDAMRSTSMDFVYEIRKQDGQQLAATGKVVVVLFDWKTRSKIQIPEELRSRVKSLQG